MHTNTSPATAELLSRASWEDVQEYLQRGDFTLAQWEDELDRRAVLAAADEIVAAAAAAPAAAAAAPHKAACTHCGLLVAWDRLLGCYTHTAFRLAPWACANGATTAAPRS